MLALHTDWEVLTLFPQPPQQDWEPRGQLVPLLEQVTQHNEGQIQGDGGIHLAEGKFCGNEREMRDERAAQGQPREALQDSRKMQGLR